VTATQVARYIAGNVRTFGVRPAAGDVLYPAARKVADVRVL
jgi:hypothetical protein